MADKNIEIRGNVLKFQDIPVQTAYNFLENVGNLPRSRSWYIMVERKGDCLQLARYQPHKGVDLEETGKQIKEYYLQIIPESNADLRERIGAMKVKGNDKFIFIDGIPECSINDTPLISMLVEDLVTLLNKKK